MFILHKNRVGEFGGRLDALHLKGFVRATTNFSFPFHDMLRAGPETEWSIRFFTNEFAFGAVSVGTRNYASK